MGMNDPDAVRNEGNKRQENPENVGAFQMHFISPFALPGFSECGFLSDEIGNMIKELHSSDAIPWLLTVLHRTNQKACLAEEPVFYQPYSGNYCHYRDDYYLRFL